MFGRVPDGLAAKHPAVTPAGCERVAGPVEHRFERADHRVVTRRFDPGVRSRGGHLLRLHGRRHPGEFAAVEAVPQPRELVVLLPLRVREDSVAQFGEGGGELLGVHVEALQSRRHGPPPQRRVSAGKDP